MANDVFLKIDKMKGESQDATHKDEIEILAWSWGLSQTGTTHVGSGGTAGRVNVQDISFTKWVDTSTHNLMMYCASGKHISEAMLTLRKASGDREGNALEYLKIKLEDAIVTSVSTGGSGGEERLTENVTLNFAKVNLTYTPQDSKGQGMAEMQFGWDVPANKGHTS